MKNEHSNVLLDLENMDQAPVDHLDVSASNSSGISHF